MSENVITADFLSKENIANLYTTLTKLNELTNLTKQVKDKIITQLIDVMKKVFKTLDLPRINKNNMMTVKKQYNDAVIRQMTEILKNINKVDNKYNSLIFNIFNLILIKKFV